MEARTYLFVPGNRPERFDKALASGADAVVLDLEDAVAPAQKDQARDAVAAWLTAASAEVRSRVVVRINDVNHPAYAADVRALRESGARAVMLPKAESGDDVRALADAVGDCAVLPLVESARGVANAAAIAGAPNVSRLVFGTIDYALDLDLAGDGLEALSYAASVLAVTSRAFGLLPPVAGVTVAVDDEAALLDDLAWARRHGLSAKLCIHPRQVAPIHAALAPSEAEVAWARRVIAANDASPGAAVLDGRMIDRPVALRAQRILARATT